MTDAEKLVWRDMAVGLDGLANDIERDAGDDEKEKAAEGAAMARSVAKRMRALADGAILCKPEPVYLVATGETLEGREELYTRHDELPPLCDAERLHEPIEVK